MEKRQKQVWRLTLAATLLLLAALLWGLYRSGFFAALRTPRELQAYIDRFAPFSQLVFFLLQLSSVLLAPIPSNLTAAAGGLLFGTALAFLLSWGAVALGSLLIFQLSRVLGRPFAEGFVSRRSWERYEEVFRRKRDLFLFLAFLFPFFPDDLLCIMAGLTDIPFRRYLALVVLARPWGLLAACAVGDSVLRISPAVMALLGLGGALVFLLVLKYGDQLRQGMVDRLRRA